MKKINTYGYMVIKHSKYNMPLFVVEIYSSLVHGIHFFNNNKDANNFIQKEKAGLKNYGIKLEYDYDFDFGMNNPCINAIQNSNCIFSDTHKKEIFAF